MIKKILIMIICACFFVNTISINADTKEEYETKYLPVLCLNNHKSTNYEVLVKDDKIYMSAENVKKLIQYETLLNNKNDEGDELVFEKYENPYDFDIYFVINDEEIITNYGTFKYDGLLKLDDSKYYLEIY